MFNLETPQLQHQDMFQFEFYQQCFDHSIYIYFLGTFIFY